MFSNRVKTKSKIVKKMLKVLLKLIILDIIRRITPKSFIYCYNGYFNQIASLEAEFDTLEIEYELAQLIND